MNDQVADAPTPPPTPWWFLIRIFDEPATVFRALRDRAQFVAPIVALVAVSLFAAFVTPAEQLQEQARQQVAIMRNRISQMPEERRQAFETRLQNQVSQAASPQRRAMIAVGGAVVPLIAFAVAGLLLALIFNAMSAERVSFKTEYSLLLYTFLPQLAGIVLTVVLALAGMRNVQLSLGFLTDVESSPFMFALLSQIGVFALWGVYLLALGNQIVSRAKGIAGPLAIVGGLWLLKDLFFAGLAGFAAGMAG